MKTKRRRAKEARTDYKARFALLKSEKPRLIIRKTNRYILTQIVLTETAQDKVVATVLSKELLSKNWPVEKKGSLKSLVASYLTGFLIARRAKGIVKEVVLDIGMHRNVHGSRIYAAVKGALDAGLNILIDQKVLPTMERIMSNKNVSKSLIEKIKEELRK